MIGLFSLYEIANRADNGSAGRRWKSDGRPRQRGANGPTGTLKLPGDILREHPDKKSGPDLEERMIRIDQAGGTDQPGGQ